MKQTVISLCDRTGVMVRPFAEAGHPCLCLDWQHSIRADRVEGNITYRWADIHGVTAADLPENPCFVFAFPDCTHGAGSGARDWRKKGLVKVIQWLSLFEKCRQLCEWFRCPYLIEQPVVDEVISRHWRPPDYRFHPWEYGDLWTKKTQLWTGGGFVMPTPIHADPPPGTTDKIHKMPPGPERADLRSETPPNFARAVFEANRHLLGASHV